MIPYSSYPIVSINLIFQPTLSVLIDCYIWDDHSEFRQIFVILTEFQNSDRFSKIGQIFEFRMVYNLEVV